MPIWIKKDDPRIAAQAAGTIDPLAAAAMPAGDAPAPAAPPIERYNTPGGTMIGDQAGVNQWDAAAGPTLGNNPAEDARWREPVSGSPGWEPNANSPFVPTNWANIERAEAPQRAQEAIAKAQGDLAKEVSWLSRSGQLTPEMTVAMARNTAFRPDAGYPAYADAGTAAPGEPEDMPGAAPAAMANNPYLTKSARSKIIVDQAETQQRLALVEQMEQAGHLPKGSLPIIQTVVRDGGSIEQGLRLIGTQINRQDVAERAQKYLDMAVENSKAQESNRVRDDQARDDYRKEQGERQQWEAMGKQLQLEFQAKDRAARAAERAVTKIDKYRQDETEIQAINAAAEAARDEADAAMQRVMDHISRPGGTPQLVASPAQAAPTTQPAQAVPVPPTPGAKLDAQTAAMFLEAAGGDKQKARQLAAASGWSF